ncbi:hypothetical protein [Streptomyces sp. NPDC006267]|uniref:hypothetical protein n=1 Tax=unclassified Streptomyces TaxID=2593676 RepID=UPI0033B96237
MKKKIASVAAALAVLGGTAVAAAPTASAVSCYDLSVSKYVGNYPNDNVAIGMFRTTTACRDINIRTTKVASAKVCFGRIGDSSNCQSTFKSTKNVWRPAAYNVYSGTDFYLLFRKPVGGFTVHVAA